MLLPIVDQELCVYKLAQIYSFAYSYPFPLLLFHSITIINTYETLKYYTSMSCSTPYDTQNFKQVVNFSIPQSSTQ